LIVNWSTSDHHSLYHTHQANIQWLIWLATASLCPRCVPIRVSIHVVATTSLCPRCVPIRVSIHVDVIHRPPVRSRVPNFFFFPSMVKAILTVPSLFLFISLSLRSSARSDGELTIQHGNSIWMEERSMLAT
jgi:hypothetical protein